jgi:hypothetical protein
LVLHGDVFDWVEQLPDGLQNLLVHRFSPMVNPGRAELEAMRACNDAMRARTRQRDGKPSRIGAPCSPADVAGRARFNVQDAQSPPVMREFLDSDTLRWRACPYSNSVSALST